MEGTIVSYDIKGNKLCIVLDAVPRTINPGCRVRIIQHKKDMESGEYEEEGR